MSDGRSGWTPINKRSSDRGSPAPGERRAGDQGSPGPSNQGNRQRSIPPEQASPSLGRPRSSSVRKMMGGPQRGQNTPPGARSPRSPTTPTAMAGSSREVALARIQQELANRPIPSIETDTPSPENVRQSPINVLPWPDRMNKDDDTHGRWNIRTTFPAAVYTRDVVARRPAWYDANSHAREVSGQMQEFFPGLQPRVAYQDGKLFGLDALVVLSEAANAEGNMLLNQWLSQEEISSTMQLSLQDLQDVVWVAHLSAWTIDGQPPRNSKYDVTKLRASRFHVWPVHLNGNHWALAIYDQAEDRAYWMDSHLTNASRQQALAFGNGYDTYLAENGIKRPDRNPIKVINVHTAQQTNLWQCGVHVLENARVFFREPVSSENPGQHWHRSESYRGLREQGDVSDAGYERHMLSLWIDFIRRELGHPLGEPIRHPAEPTISSRQRRHRWQIPNSLAKDTSITDKNWLEHFKKLTISRPSRAPTEERGAKRSPSVALSAMSDASMMPNFYSDPDKYDQWYAARSNTTLSRAQRARKASEFATGFPESAPTPDKDDKHPADVVVTYHHLSSPNRHLSPTHEAGWTGWDDFEQELDAVSRMLEEGKRADAAAARDERAQRRQQR